MRMLMWVAIRGSSAIRGGCSGRFLFQRGRCRVWGHRWVVVFRLGSTIWSTALRRSSRRQMPTIRTDRRRLVSPQRLTDFKTPRVVKIGYPIRIQEGEALRGDGKILVEMSGVRLDRVAMLTAA